MQKYGKFGEIPVPQLDHESKMRLLKTHSHTSERPGYEARKNAKNAIKGNADTIRRQTTCQNLPRTASVARGARRKGRYGETNHRQNPPAYRQRGGGEARRRKANGMRTQARRQGKPKSKPSRGYHRGGGGETKGENQHEMERWHNPQSCEGGGSA